MNQTTQMSNSMPDLENVADLYVRVSSTEQAEEGYSVAEQEARLRNYCAALGIVIHAVHIDPGFSGATLDRPGIKKVISDVEHKRCKKVIVWKLDRLSRSQKDTLILLEDVFLANDCNFISLMESFDTSTPFGRCIVGILAAFAQMERENIKARTTMGRQARVREGHFHAGHAPIGYKFQTASDGTLISNDIIPDPYAAKQVQEVFRLFISGWNASRISRHMVETYGSNLYGWGHNTAILRILSNPVYMGKVRIHNQLYQGIHEALISETDWYMANAKMERSRELNTRTYAYRTGHGPADNLLTGLIFCGDCGARMFCKKFYKETRRYVCHSVIKSSPTMVRSDHCTNTEHPYTVQELDNIVLNEIKKLALDRSAFDSACESASERDPEESAIYEERLSDVNRQIERLLILYQTGIVELDDITERIENLKKEKAQLESNLADMDTVPITETKESAWEMASSLQAVLDSGDMESVHRIVHSLIDKVVVLNSDVTIYWSFS